MMLNKLPPHTPLNSILSYLGSSDRKHSDRDRAIFALRNHMRIRDISILLVSDIVNVDGTIRSEYITTDGKVYYLDTDVQNEISLYIKHRFNDGLPADMNVPLFSTQKRAKFSNNTLAQHFSHLDKIIWEEFGGIPSSTKNYNKE